MDANKNKKIKRFFDDKRRLALIIIFVAILSPVLLGLFQTKGAGTLPPSIWYDEKTGHYSMSVAALQYSGILDDNTNDDPLRLDESIMNRAFNFHGDSNLLPYDVWFVPPVGTSMEYFGCSLMVPSDVGIYGFSSWKVGCYSDVSGGWTDDPVELFEGSLAGSGRPPDLGFDGTQDIDAITVFLAISPPVACGEEACLNDFILQTIYVPSSGTEGLIDFINANYPLGVISVFDSIFIANGAGNDYTISSTSFELLRRSGYPIESGPYAIPHVSSDSINAPGVSVSFWGTDGIGGVRDDEFPDAVMLSGTKGSPGGKVNLSWPAIVDPTPSGDEDVYSYQVRYALSLNPGDGEITDANFDNFSEVTEYSPYPGWGDPLAPPETENNVIDGLATDAWYQFAIKACDKFNNCGPASNSARIKSSGKIAVFQCSPSLVILNEDGTPNNTGVTDDNLINLGISTCGRENVGIANAPDLASEADVIFVSEAIGEKWNICSEEICPAGNKTINVQVYEADGVTPFSLLSVSIEYTPPQKSYYNTELSINNDDLETLDNLVSLGLNNLDPEAKIVKVLNISSEEASGDWESNINNEDAKLVNIEPGEDGSTSLEWDLCQEEPKCLEGTKWVIVQTYGSSIFEPLSEVLLGSIELKLIEAIPTLTIAGADGNNDSTSNGNVILSIDNSGLDIVEMRIANTGYPAEILPFSPTLSWNLCKNGGCTQDEMRTVNVMLIDSTGKSFALSASIPFIFPIIEPVEDEIPIEVIPPPIKAQPVEPTIPEVDPEPIIDVEPEPEVKPEPIVQLEPESLLAVAYQKINEVVDDYGTTISTTVLAIVAYASVLSMASSFADLWAIVRYLVTLLLQFLGIKRKNKEWGVVYDGVAKEPLPLCIVRLFDAKTNVLKQSAVTDQRGYFGMFPVRGAYYMTVTKPMFAFPSHLMKGVSNDIGYSSLYFGEKKLFSGKSAINLAVPLDKFGIKKKRKFLVAVRSLLIDLSTPIAVFGAIITLAVLIINPVIINAVMLALYLVVLVIKKTLLFPAGRHPVRITDVNTGKSLSGVAIKVFSKKYGKLVAVKVSDKRGNLDLLFPDGQYFLRLASSKYEFAKDKRGDGYTGEVLNMGKDGASNLKIYLKLIKNKNNEK